MDNKLLQEKVKNSKQLRFLNNLFSVLTLLPILTVICLVTLYLLTALDAGQLPIHGTPVPKHTAFYLLSFIVFAGILLSMASFPIWIMIAKTLSTYITARQWWLHAVVYSLSIMIFWFITQSTPIMEWFID